MTTTYITTEKYQPPPMQTTYITTIPVQPQSQPQPTQTTYIEVTTAPRARYRWANNRHKTHSATAGILLFAYGGMDMAQGLGWNIGTYIFGTYEFLYSWFIGVIIGAVVAAFTMSLVPKSVFYTLGGIMQLIDAIICVSAPYDYTPMLAARYVGGTGIGLITVAFIIHTSEITSRNTRGQWSSLEQYGLALGIAIQVIMDSQWVDDSSFGINQAHGIFGIIFSLIATATVVISLESPIYYLRKNNEEKARACQQQLMSSYSADAFNRAFEEAKRYVAENTSLSTGVQLTSSVMPFIKMLFCRCLVAFTFSLPLSWAMATSAVVSEGYLDWTVVVWVFLRWIGTFITIAIVDKVGRKFLSLLGLLCMAGLMLGMAGIYSDSYNMTDWYYMDQVCRISMAFQFFAGLYVSCTPTYLGEAFPMHVKPFLIALIVCIEQVIHIIVIVTFLNSYNSFYQYFLAVGIILVVSLLIFAAIMPETRGLTLRQAGERFRRPHDVKAY